MSPEKEPSFFSYRPDGEGFNGWRQMRDLPEGLRGGGGCARAPVP